MDSTVSEWLNLIFRWIHVLAGVMWIGHLWFFNFVNAQVAKTYDAESKKKVVPELMPRALWVFRWGAAWTWVTGVLLLMLVFWHGGLVGSWVKVAGFDGAGAGCLEPPVAVPLAQPQHALGLPQPEQRIDRQQLADQRGAGRADHPRLGLARPAPPAHGPDARCRRPSRTRRTDNAIPRSPE